MNLDRLLSTIILVSFLVTIVMAVGSYLAYKLRESRRPRHDGAGAADALAAPPFERVTVEAWDAAAPGPRGQA